MDPEELEMDAMSPEDFGVEEDDSPVQAPEEPVVEETPIVEDESPVVEDIDEGELEEDAVVSETAVEDAPAEPSEVEVLRAQLEQQQQMLSKILSGKSLVEPPEPEAPAALTPEQQAQQYWLQMQLHQQQAAQQAAQAAQPQTPAQPAYVDEKLYDEILSEPEAFQYIHPQCGDEGT